MTTDPPPAEFEDVRIDNWQTRLPSAICTNKEIFNEIFSLETWKTVLKPDQRDRILKMLPPEILKTPGAAEKTMEDLFSKTLTNFDSNPLDTVFESLENGHYDPEVVETKTNIVREWRRESRRLMKHYHTKLLQDIVISREKHLRKFLPLSAVHKRNGKKSVSATATATSISNASSKKNGKPDSGAGISLNGVTGAKGNNLSNLDGSFESADSSPSHNSLSRNVKPVLSLDQLNKNKRGRLETALLSPPNSAKDGVPSPVEGPAKKKAKQSQTSKSKSSNKKSKDSISSSQPSPSSLSQPVSSPLLLGNGSSYSVSNQQNASLLMGTLTTGSSHLDPPTLSLRSPSSSQSSLLPPSSLLESLISPISSSPLPPPQILSGKSETSKGTKLFPSPSLSSSSSPASQSFLQSPVQSSPILASQLQAPSPISVNLSTLTGSLGSSRNDSITDSPSNSSITLNYTQTPPPSATPSSQQHMKGLMGDDSSSDEFEFESIEPTIGFSGPSTLSSSKSVASIKTLTSSSASAAVSALATPEYKKSSISTQELQNIQKCSLLTNCLTQPLPANSSANAAVSAALANNILTSTPVPVSTAVMAVGGNTSSTIHHHQVVQQQSQGQLPQHKIIVTSGGALANVQQQQLQKFLSTSSQQHTAQKLITQQHLNVFQQQQQQKNNVICATVPSSSPAPVQTQVDAQTLVNSLMASPKDLFATFGASISSVGANMTTALQVQPHIQQQHSNFTSPNTLPIAVNLQGASTSTTLLQQQQGQMKHATFIRAPATSLQNSGLLNTSTTTVIGGLSHQQQQILSLSSGTGTMVNSPQSILIGGGHGGSSLNTQSLQLPASILSSGTCNISNLGKSSSLTIPSVHGSPSIPNLLDSDDLGLNLGSFTLGGMSLDMGVTLPELDTSGIGGVVGSVESMKLELECGIDKMDDLSGVLDGNPFDSIPNLSDDLDGLDLDMVDGLCDFEVLLSEEKQYASFFSLIRDVLCSTRDHRMTLVCLEKTVRKWSISPGASLNPWYMRIHDWNSGLIVALNFLAGNYQDVHPEDFVPYIEYKYKTKYYQWIGAGRDGDNNLTPLCTLWMDNLERLPPLKKSDGDGDEPEEEEDENEDSDSAGVGETTDAKKKNKRPQTPPPPRCTTDWTVRSSTLDEKEEFRAQEKCRFDNPHKAFTYRMHGYESVVGPVKGVYSSQTGVTNKARGHSLLVDDRPPYVTILALVRDAVARLPNGEGTRSEICEMLRDSAFLAPEASNVTLNSVVSGALDRLHYERDPCVRYDSHKKSWIYLHRDRTQEQFERLHHNRSYTKSTKSRNNTSRKSRKGSSKSSSSSAASTPVTPAPTTIITVDTSTSQSSSTSSQNSISTVEAIVKPAPGAASANVTSGGVVSTTTSGGSLVTLPPLSTITPKAQSLTPAPTAASSLLQQQVGKQSIGLVSVSASNVQIQNQGLTQTLSGSLQQQTLTTAVAANRGLISFPANSVTIPDGSVQQQGQPSLNEILAAAAGLRFQPSSGGQGTSIVLNQNSLGTQQGKLLQTFIQQESSGSAPGSTRLVLQQQPQAGGQNVAVQQLNTVQQQSAILVQQPQQQSQQTSATTAIAPGQMLLSPSSTVLKLAGNIRLGEGLRFTQLRLPTGTATGGAPAATAPLRLPQHRILLTRGALSGQPQTQGVLLGQTSTGQTVILSAGGTGTGTAIAGLQQALNTGGNTGTGSLSTGQIALHPTQSQTQTVQLESTAPSSSSVSPGTTSVAQQSQSQQTQQIQQHLQSQQAIASQNIQTYSANKGTQKFGIITNVPGNSNSVMVSTVGASTASSLRTSFASTTRVNPVGPATTPTLPPTSIALPASLLAPAQPPIQPVTFSNTPTSVSIQSPPNVSHSTSHPPQQQQIIFTNSNGGGTSTMQQQQTQQVQVQQQQINSIQGSTGTTVQGTMQLQSVTQSQSQTMQHITQPQQHQSFILQPQQNSSQQLQGLTLGQGQGQHQLAAPIIIRSAQGEFVSFGIPSHLSLGRGVQGIKVIPIQSGNKTMFARIVAPTTLSSGGNNVASVSTSSSPLLVTGGQGANLLSTVSAVPSSVINTSSVVTPVISGASLSSLSSSSIMSTPMQAQMLTVSSGTSASQYAPQSPILVQSQSQNNFPVSTVSSSNVSGGLGTITLSSAITSASASPINSTVANSQSSNNNVSAS